MNDIVQAALRIARKRRFADGGDVGYDPFAAEKFANPAVDSYLRDTGKNISNLATADFKPSETDPNDPVMYRTASPLVNFTRGDINNAIDAGLNVAGTTKSVGRLPMDEASRMARAAEQGFTGDWYHGGQRMDRFTESGKIDPRRATSGPMPYFTDSPEMASSYATGKKADTSLMDEGNVRDYFTVSQKDLGLGGRRQVPVEQSWHYLPPETKADILEKAKRVGYENLEEGSGPLVLHPPGVNGTMAGDQFDFIMKREARGNPLAALRDLWHDSGRLYDDPGTLSEVYRLSGYPHPISETNAPWTEARGVIPVKLKMRNPLNTEDQETITSKVLPALEEAFKRDRSRKQEFGADMWDKNSRFTPREWVQEAKQDYAKGDNSFVWTSIPDKVTAELRRLGYDGIIDTGGKMGGQSHKVAIPFGPEQVRSRFAKFDPAKIDSKDLLAGIAAAPTAGLAASMMSREDNHFASGGSVNSVAPAAYSLASRILGRSDTGMNVPEIPQTLQAQQGQLINGQRAAQMFPQGSPELPVPAGMGRTETPRGAFHYDPKRVDPMTIARLSHSGRENELLSLGPFNKEDIAKRIAAGEPPVAIIERAPDGSEVKSAVGTPSTVKAQHAAFELTKSPGSVIGVEPLDDVVNRRRGGGVPNMPSHGQAHVGPILSHVPGRTDHIAMKVPANSFVIPADIVSGLGQGNSEAGHKVLTHMFPPNVGRSSGGAVDIMAAGGEYVVSPDECARIGGGDMDKGHKVLDRFVIDQRKRLVKTLSKLPGPVKDHT